MWVNHTSSIHHSTDGMSTTQHRLANWIRALQQKHAQLCPTHDLRFHLSEEEFGTLTETQLQNWLNIYENLTRFQICIRWQANLINQSLLIDFFRSV